MGGRWAIAVVTIALWACTARGDDDPVAPAPAPAPDFAERLGVNPVFRIRGRLDIDALFPVESQASAARYGNYQNAFGFRRARLGAEGTIPDSARWIAEFELAGGDVRFRDVFVGITSFPVISELRIGNAREPFSLEGATSARFITFMERSPLNALDPARHWGVAAYWNPENQQALAALGFFRSNSDQRGVSTGDAGDWAVTTRLTGLPIYEDAERFRLLHLGAAISQRRPPNGFVTYNPTPQSNLIDVADSPVSPFLPQVDIPSNSQQLYNLQAAAVNGSFSVQGEWFGTTIQQVNAGSVFFHGFYAYASWFPTGEHRGYDLPRGSFDRVNVLRPLIKTRESRATGCGAVELALRFSVANFESSNLPFDANAVSPVGTVLYQTTAGVNWYLNDFTRLMANYTLAIPTSPGLSALPIHLFGFRTAIYW